MGPSGALQGEGHPRPLRLGLGPLWGGLLQHALSCSPPIVPGRQGSDPLRAGGHGASPAAAGGEGTGSTLVWCPPSATDFTIKGPRAGGTWCNPRPSPCLCPQAAPSQLRAGGCWGTCGLEQLGDLRASRGTSEHLPRCPVQACMARAGGALLWPMCRAVRLCQSGCSAQPDSAELCHASSS